MHETSAIPARDDQTAPTALRELGLLAETQADPESVMAALDAIAAPDWEREASGPALSTWDQRLVHALPAIATGIFTVGSVDPTRPLYRDRDGWMTVRTRPISGAPGTRIEIHGELDEAMELAVSTALRDLDAGVRRRWGQITTGRARPKDRGIPVAMRPRPSVRRRRVRRKPTP